MTRQNLTDLSIQRLKPPEKGQTTVFDASLRGFGVRLSQGGSKTFVLMTGKERRLITIGRYPDISLKDARARAKALQAQETGKAPSTTATTFLEACSSFEQGIRGRVKPATREQYMYYLRTLDFNKKLTQVTKTDINEKLKLFDGKAYAQNYAFTSLRVFFNWCLTEGLIEKHPLIRVRPPNKVQSRDRVLTDDEMVKIWNACPDNNYGRIMRCLILTGQRRMEIANVQPEHITNVLTLTVKGGKTHILPLTPLVRQYLHVPFKFNDWSRSKTRFDARCGVSFRHHDLRRTLATKLAELGVSPHVIERILAHSDGGVQAIYQRYSFLKEIEEALLTYEAHIIKITTARVQPEPRVAPTRSYREDTKQARATPQDHYLDTAHHQAGKGGQVP